MSQGYGGNLTFPALRQFTNSDGSKYTGFEDARYDPDAANDVRFITEQIGFGSIPYLAGASSDTLIWGKEAVAKESTVTLNGDMPCTACPYDFGFAIKTVPKKPGVLNSMLYGKVRPYFSSATSVMDAGDGTISSEDHLKQTSEILGLILADVGLSNVDTEQRGAVVDAYMTTPVAYTDANTVVVSIPELGLSTTIAFAAGTVQTVDQVNALLEAQGMHLYVYAYDSTGAGIGANDVVGFRSYYDGDYAIVGGAVSTTVLGIPSSYVVTQTAGAAVLINSDSTISLRTKAEYVAEYNYEIQEVSDGTTFITNTEGEYEYFSSDEIWRWFAHRRNDRGYANFWRGNPQPVNVATVEDATFDPTTPADGVAPLTSGWYKWIGKTHHTTASIHGASHGNNYQQVMELYIPEVGWPSGATAGNVGAAGGAAAGTTTYEYLLQLSNWWSRATADALPIW